MLASSQITSNDSSLDITLLRALDSEAFPRSGADMLSFEHRVFAASTRAGDQIVRAQIDRAHADPVFVADAVEAARAAAYLFVIRDRA